MGKNAPTNAEQDWVEATPQGATDLTTMEITDTAAAIDRFKRIITFTGTSGKTQIFDANNSGSYLSSHDPRLLVGLGADADVRKVEVAWPSGRVQTISAPQIDRYLVINESKVDVRRLSLNVP